MLSAAQHIKILLFKGSLCKKINWKFWTL